MKPNDFPINKSGGAEIDQQQFCPFCEGNENHTPPEVAAFRNSNQPVNGPGWSIRVVPNKFSPFKLRGGLDLIDNGIFQSCNLLGKHEVLVETPHHGLEFHNFDTGQIELVYRMVCQRYSELSADQRIKYIQIYKNRGLFAGASMTHSHTQILALPAVPGENRGLLKYYNQHHQCLLCSVLKEEKKQQVRVVGESEYFLIICPYASRFSYESWIIPKKHAEHFNAISNEELEDLAETIKAFLLTIVECLDNPSYNIVINTAPVNVPYCEGYHWFLEIVPRLIVNAGVEFATGCYMNPVAPELAAVCFRDRLSEYHSKLKINQV
jgi:UDPglucose--hexose-1-phosphate uridylyltransferase